MGVTLDLSMRKEFDDTLGSISAVVSYRNKTNIITIPHQNNLILISSEPELEPTKVIQMVHQNMRLIMVAQVV